jgi:hypothetical protein
MDLIKVHDVCEFGQFTNFNNIYFVALANERMGAMDRALLFADRGVQSDHLSVVGANYAPRWRSFCQGVRGRVLARSEQRADAEVAFEAAVAEAQSCKLVTLECLALRDIDRFLQLPAADERLCAAKGNFAAGELGADDALDLNRILDVHSTFEH